VPDRVAVSIGETRLSYAELHRRAASFAAFFHELDIGRGDVVAAQLPNGLEFLLTYLAAGYVGASLQTCTCLIGRPSSSSSCAMAAPRRSSAWLR
jgi:cyclohexanecarboxylate-CoA ligase